MPGIHVSGSGNGSNDVNQSDNLLHGTIEK